MRVVSRPSQKAAESSPLGVWIVSQHARILAGSREPFSSGFKQYFRISSKGLFTLLTELRLFHFFRARFRGRVRAALLREWGRFYLCIESSCCCRAFQRCATRVAECVRWVVNWLLDRGGLLIWIAIALPEVQLVAKLSLYVLLLFAPLSSIAMWIPSIFAFVIVYISR